MIFEEWSAITIIPIYHTVIAENSISCTMLTIYLLFCTMLTIIYSEYMINEFKLDRRLKRKLPEHDPGSSGKLDKLPKTGKGLHRETSPSERTTTKSSITIQPQNHDPPSKVLGDGSTNYTAFQHGNKQPGYE